MITGLQTARGVLVGCAVVLAGCQGLAEPDAGVETAEETGTVASALNSLGTTTNSRYNPAQLESMNDTCTVGGAAAKPNVDAASAIVTYLLGGPLPSFPSSPAGVRLRTIATAVKSVISAGPSPSLYAPDATHRLRTIGRVPARSVCGLLVDGTAFDFWVEVDGTDWGTALAGAMVEAYGSGMVPYAYMNGSRVLGAPYRTTIIDPEPVRLSASLAGGSASASATGVHTGDAVRLYYAPAPGSGSIVSSAPVGAPCTSVRPFSDTTSLIHDVLAMPVTRSRKLMQGRRVCVSPSSSLYPIED
jgi:hypothetical protein